MDVFRPFTDRPNYEHVCARHPRNAARSREQNGRTNPGLHGQPNPSLKPALSVAALKVWGRLCGWTLARGHARSGDCIAISAYLGQSDSFDRAIVSFAQAYADQNEQDYAAFQKALKDKRIAAVAGI